MVGWSDSGIPDSPNEMYEDLIAAVVFKDGVFELDDEMCAPIGYHPQDVKEVIGNIYEHPELLTPNRTT
jgi:hypothetical protein